MTEQDRGKQNVDLFLHERIDTIPHLEALLLLWNSRPRTWSAEDMAKGLFVPVDAARKVLDDLVRLHLIGGASGAANTYWYEAQPDLDPLIASVDRTYRQELIRVTKLIHSKAPSAVREFARAFRLKKDNG